MSESAPVTEIEEGPRLIPLGHHEGKPAMPLTRMATLIGTHKHAHLHLESSSISKHHAVVITTAEGSYISDLGSRTKVIINGRTVREGPLRDGDELRLGKFVFRYANSMPQAPKANLPRAVIVDESGISEAIEHRVLVIGSRAGCDVMVEEAAVSGRHAIVFEAAGKRYVRDLSSRTGTNLNGTKIRQAEISFGDQVHIGGTTLHLESSEAADAAAAEDATERAEEKIDIFAPPGFPATGQADSPAAASAAPTRRSSPPAPVAPPAVEARAAAPSAPVTPAEKPEEPIIVAALERDLPPLVLAPTPKPVKKEKPVEEPQDKKPAPAKPVEMPAEESSSGLDLNPLGAALRDAAIPEAANPTPESARAVAPQPFAAPSLPIAPAVNANADKVDLSADPDISGDSKSSGDTAILRPGPKAPTVELAPASRAAPRTPPPPMEADASAGAGLELSWPRRGWRGESARPSTEETAKSVTADVPAAAAEISLAIEPPAPAKSEPLADTWTVREISLTPFAPEAVSAAESAAEPVMKEPVATPAPAVEEVAKEPVAQEPADEVETEEEETAARRGRPPKGSSARKGILDRAVAHRVPPPRPAEEAATASEAKSEDKPQVAQPVVEQSTAPVTAAAPAPVETAEGAEPYADQDAVEQAVEIDFLNLKLDLTPPGEPAESAPAMEEPAIEPPEATTLVAMESARKSEEPGQASGPMVLGEEVSQGSNSDSHIFEASVRHEPPSESAAKATAKKDGAEQPIEGLQLDTDKFAEAKPAEAKAPEAKTDDEGRIVGLHFDPEVFAKPQTVETRAPAAPVTEAVTVSTVIAPEPAEVEAADVHENSPAVAAEAEADEVMAAEDVSPEATLDLDLELPPMSGESDAASEAESAGAEMDDTDFGQAIQSIGGESSGPLVEEAQGTPITATAPTDLPLDAPADLPAEEKEPVQNVEQPPRSGETTSAPQAEAVADSAGAVPPPPAPSAAAPAVPARGMPFPPLSGAQVISLSGSAVFGLGTVNFDHFLGGMPVKLNVPPPSSPPPKFGKTPIRVEGSLNAPLADALFSGEESLANTMTGAASLPHSQAGGGPFSSAAFDVAPDGVSIAEPASKAKTPDAPTDAGKGGGRTPMAFDGLALGAAAEKDVFSSFPVKEIAKAAAPDLAFGAGAGPGAQEAEEASEPGYDDPVFSASPQPPPDASPMDDQKDFAEDEFWNQTHEQEPGAAENAAKKSAAPQKPARRSSYSTPVRRAQYSAPAEPVDEPLEPLPSAEAAPMETEASEPPDIPDAVAASGAPKKKRKRRWLIPFLMGSMLISMGGAVAAIRMLVPERSSVTGTLTYLNFNWVDGTQDGTDFSVAQQRLLADEQTRLHAIDLLKQHGSIPPGFLGERSAYLLVTGNMSLASERGAGTEQTRLTMRVQGSDESGDKQRMSELLQSTIDGSAGLLDQNRRHRDAAEAARHEADEAGAAQEQLKTEAAALQRTISKAPAEDAFAAMTEKKAKLLQARLDAEDAVDSDRNEVAHLEANPASGDSRTAAADPELEQIRAKIAELTGKLQAARLDQASGVVATRAKLADAERELNAQLNGADQALAAGSPLKAVIDAAQDQQHQNQPLFKLLMDNGQDFEKQLDDTRRDLEDLIQNRQQEKWAADAVLKNLQADLESAQHRYNASVGEGVSDPAVLNPLQEEIKSRTAQVKARQAELALDPNTVKIENGLSKLIDTLRGKLQREIKQLAASTESLDKQLAGVGDGATMLPAEQQTQAQQMRRDLAAVADAWHRYGSAVAQVQVAPSLNVTDLQKQIDQLQSRFDGRQAALADQMQKSADPRIRELAEARRKLDADKSAMAASKKAYDALWMDYENQASLREDAETAEATLVDLNAQLAKAADRVDTAVRDREQKASLAERSFDIKPLSEGDILGSAIDPRWNYSLYAVGGLAVVFALATFAASHQGPGIADEHEMIDIAPEQEMLTAEIIDARDIDDEDDHEAAVV
jgi:pSer/pThr/pTyr-binding forkhead associated (FHA) protein